MLAAVLACLSPLALAAQDTERWWGPAVAQALERAGDNAAELARAIAEVPPSQRAALEHLVAGMPDADLRTLDAAFLLDELALAHLARDTAPWGAALPDAVFFDAVVPYAQVTETREAWRRSLRERCLPWVGGCTTPGQAALAINQRLFGAVGVRYSTERRRADQSPSESIAQGVASCTGLSILLADACRAVGVPARLAGIREWVGKGGNHTWVEVWDDGGWHFLGAAEPDPRGLDHAWFTGDAALAIPGDARHGVFAVTWTPTGERFPIAWRRGAQVHGVDVTARYAKGPRVAAGAMRLMVEVQNEHGERVGARVVVSPEAGGAESAGTSHDGTHDTNDHLTFEVARGQGQRIRAEHGARSIEIVHATRDAEQELVVLRLPATDTAALAEAAAKWFAADVAERAAIEFPAAAEQLLRDDEEKARAVVWDAYRTAGMHAAARADFEARRVRTADRQSPYTVATVGERPAGGWALAIAMHGGGGVKKEVNDSQWRHMQRYYEPRPEAGGYLYVALRAPNDTWNGFYDDAIAPLVAELIRHFVLFGDVDPDKVMLLGYSHGGYGAFAIGPKIPDRFAAVHASAAAPTPGVTAARNLRNLRFSFMVGERDTAYGRAERCQAFAREIEALRAAAGDAAAYPVVFEWQEGFGHGGLPDRGKIAAMYAAVREPAPRAIRFEATDARITDCYWLTVHEPKPGQRVDAVLRDGEVVIESKDAGALTLWLDRRLVGEVAALRVRRDGAASEVALAPSAAVLCESTLRRGDPRLAATMRVDVPRGEVPSAEVPRAEVPADRNGRR